MAAGDDGGAVALLLARHWRSAHDYAAVCLATTGHPAQLVAAAAVHRVLGRLASGRPGGALRPQLLVAVRDTVREWAGAAGVPDELPELGKTIGGRGLRAARAATPERRQLAEHAFQSLPASSQCLLWHTEVEAEPISVPAGLLGIDTITATAGLEQAREQFRARCVRAHLDLAPTADCRFYHRLLDIPLRRGGELLPDVRGHLAQCRHCRHTAEQLSHFDDALDILLAETVLSWGARRYLDSRPGRAAIDTQGDPGRRTGLAAAVPVWGAALRANTVAWRTAFDAAVSASRTVLGAAVPASRRTLGAGVPGSGTGLGAGVPGSGTGLGAGVPASGTGLGAGVPASRRTLGTGVPASGTGLGAGVPGSGTGPGAAVPASRTASRAAGGRHRGAPGAGTGPSGRRARALLVGVGVSSLALLAGVLATRGSSDDNGVPGPTATWGAPVGDNTRPDAPGTSGRPSATGSSSAVSTGSPAEIAHGRLRSRAIGLCLDTAGGRTEPGTPVVLADCSAAGSQQWSYRGDGLLHSGAAPTLCLAADPERRTVALDGCVVHAGEVFFDLTVRGELLLRRGGGLAVTAGGGGTHPGAVVTERDGSEGQRWAFETTAAAAEAEGTGEAEREAGAAPETRTEPKAADEGGAQPSPRQSAPVPRRPQTRPDDTAPAPAPPTETAPEAPQHETRAIQADCCEEPEPEPAPEILDSLPVPVDLPVDVSSVVTSGLGAGVRAEVVVGD
ncbi:ricin-type beta-trefoil lectin domain protein [Streptomyces sp. NPDC018693]